MKRIKRLFDVKCPYCKGAAFFGRYNEYGYNADPCDTCQGQGKVSPKEWVKHFWDALANHFRPTFDPFAEDKK